MVKTDLKGVGRKCVNGITLAQDRNDCCVLLNMIVNSEYSEYFTGWGSIIVSEPGLCFVELVVKKRLVKMWTEFMDQWQTLANSWPAGRLPASEG